jgi:hypothetical protein
MSLSRDARKLLFQLVQQTINLGLGNAVQLQGANSDAVRALRHGGYLLDTDEITKKAFLKYFAAFDDLTCPIQVQNWADAFGIRDLQWKRADDILKGSIGVSPF